MESCNNLKPLTEKQKRNLKILEMYNEGLCYSGIAKYFDIYKGSVVKIVSNFKHGKLYGEYISSFTVEDLKRNSSNECKKRIDIPFEELSPRAKQLVLKYT